MTNVKISFPGKVKSGCSINSKQAEERRHQCQEWLNGKAGEEERWRVREGEQDIGSN